MSIRAIRIACSSRRSASVRPERGARNLSLDRRRQDVREGALQGRVHERERRAHRSERSRTSSTRRSGSSSRASSRAARSAARRGGIFKSTDGGSTWKQLDDGTSSRARRRISPSRRRTRRCSTRWSRARHRCRRRRAAPTRSSGSTSRSTPASTGISPRTIRSPTSGREREPDGRPLLRIGGGDLPTLAVDPKNENVVYSASIVFWRTEDGGVTWSAVRGSPGGDDYQKVVDQSEQSEHPARRLRSGRGRLRRIAARRGATGTPSPRPRCITCRRTHRSVYRVCGGQQDSGSACVDSRSMDGEITFHDWHPVNIQEYGIAAPDPKDPDKVFGSMRTQRVALQSQDRADHARRPDADARGTSFNRNVRTMPIDWSPRRSERAVLHVERRVEDDRPRAQLDAHQPRSHAPDVGRAGDRRQVREHSDRAAAGRDHRAVAVAARASA